MFGNLNFFNRNDAIVEGGFKEAPSVLFMERPNNEGNGSGTRPTGRYVRRPTSPTDPHLPSFRDNSKFTVEHDYVDSRPHSLKYTVKIPGNTHEWNYNNDGECLFKVNSSVEAPRANQLRRELANNFLGALDHDFFIRGSRRDKPNAA